MIQRLLVISMLVIQGGCAAHRAEVAQRARSELVELSRTELLACMGEPLRRERTGRGETLTYLGAAPQCPLKTLFGKAPQRCEVSILLEKDRVRSIDYREPAGGALSEAGQCAFLVESCVK